MSSESLKESVIVGIVKKMKQMDMSTLIIVKAGSLQKFRLTGLQRML